MLYLGEPVRQVNGAIRHGRESDLCAAVVQCAGQHLADRLELWLAVTFRKAKDLASGKGRRLTIEKCLADVNDRLALEYAGDRMADLGIRSKPANVGHVPPFDGDAIAFGRL